MLTAEELFWRHVDKSGDCWLWKGGLEKDGYGICHFLGKWALAHRVAWILTHGEIPEGMLVLHTCEAKYAAGDRTSRRCMCHLYLGTHKDNWRDTLASGHHIVNLNHIHERNIRIQNAYVRGQISQRQLATAHGISRRTLRRILAAVRVSA